MRPTRPSRRDVLHATAALAAAGSIGGSSRARAEHTKSSAGSTHPHIDAVLRTAIAAKDIPGVVAMAANDDGIIYEGVFGLRRAGQAMTRDTVFRVASMIKTITSVAAMQLVEQGKLSLDG